MVGGSHRQSDHCARLRVGLAPPRLSFAFITDTNPIDPIVDFARDVDLMICEANYAREADRPKARERRHMLFSEALSWPADRPSADSGSPTIRLPSRIPRITYPRLRLSSLVLSSVRT